MRHSLIVALVAALVITAGCSKSPQDRYQAAANDLQAARQAQTEASQTVAKRRVALQKQEERLAAAQQKLAKTRKGVAKAQANVNRTATDEVLFRGLQRALLDSSRFSGAAAVSVQVKNHTVTLTGTVPDKSTRKAVVGYTQKYPGVSNVDNELKVQKQKKADDDHKS